ncbi:PD-(D/E)XK nuclease family protein [Aegicerativicinus sediminis]|uniref:PD-(D/E)XK nuclease family protein n=1 Tax=Aegicerativicinus sediminis TaxID=2893202 RepID=UPI001E501414|nr:PD-(D/E)XK nuclease family protein [Aegicerativicinus sediminis]
MREEIQLRALKRISPSLLTSLRKCPFKVVLSNNFKSPLLPYSPLNHLGIVIHHCIDMIYKNKINGIEEFNKEWDSCVEQEESKLLKRGFGYYLPLRDNVEGYAIKKLQTQALIQIKSNNIGLNKTNTHTSSIQTEKFLKSKDGKIGGKVDLIHHNNNVTKLCDFKTGKIFEEEGEIKKDYEDQLKLYGYLYNQEFGNYPHTLSIIDLQKKEYFVEFTSEECEEIGEFSKNRLDEINQLIINKNYTSLANPNKENCKNCLYRPACKYYWKDNKIQFDSKFQDLIGELKDLKQYNNGDITVTIYSANNHFKIYHLNKEFKNELSIKETIAAFNLIKIDEFKYKALKTTRIFKYNMFEIK